MANFFKESNLLNKEKISYSNNSVQNNSKFSFQRILKQFSLISLCVILAVFFYSSRTRHPVEIIPVMAVPVTNKVVILDAGHGTPV